jgi:hypothetical protein
MKIYFAINEEKFPNPFVSTLAKRLKEIDPDIEIAMGISTFWGDEIFSCNIVHIHWPEILLREANKTPEQFKYRLDEIKKHGGKIVATCHNITAHYAKFQWQKEAYTIVYNMSDLILHMGNYSLNLFREMYPNSKNEILPHHVYDDRYNEKISKHEAAKKLGLDPQKTYILCLGAFRDNSERNLLLGLSDFLKKNSIKILAPSFYIAPKPRNLRAIIRIIMLKLRALKLNFRHNIITCSKFVSDEEISLMGSIADLILLQRLNILNSGNLPLGFHLGKVVVGPNTGNVGEQLTQTGNPTFEINSLESLPESLEKGIVLAKAGFGEKNKMFAEQHLSSIKIAQRLLQHYKQLL